MAKMKKCKACGSQIAKNAKTCPQCGAKNKGSKLGMLLILVVVIAVIAVAFGGGEEEVDLSKVKFEKVSVAEMEKTLDENAAKAEDQYNDKYVEIEGRLGVIDSDGQYISLLSLEDDWDIIGVQCYIKNDDQKKQVLDMKIGDTVKLKGQITDVGELMGYSLDIIEIL